MQAPVVCARWWLRTLGTSMGLIAALKLVFSESAFVKAELDHVEKKRQAGEVYSPAKEFEPEARKRTKAKRRNLLGSSLWITSLVVAGALVATALNSYFPLSWLWVRVVRATSVLLLAWAVWSKVGDIQTYKGQTLLELTSQYLYKFLYSVGLFLGSVALFLEGPTGA